MSLGIGDDKLLEKYKTNFTKTRDLRNIGLNTLPAYDNRCVETIIGTYGNKV